MKMNRRNISILVLSTLAVIIIGTLLFLKQKIQSRGVASVNQEDEIGTELLDEARLTWQSTSQGLTMTLSNSAGDICDRYAEMQVVFKAEGIAYSGEVDRVIQTTQCENRKFQQSWKKNLTQDDDPGLIRQGYFLEEPPQWVVENVKLVGYHGEIKTNAAKIREIYGSFPTLIPKK